MTFYNESFHRTPFLGDWDANVLLAALDSVGLASGPHTCFKGTGPLCTMLPLL